MADFCDQASDIEQMQRDIAIKKRRDEVVKNIDGDGSCLECGNTVAQIEHNGQMRTPRWCCIECREIWKRDNE